MPSDRLTPSPPGTTTTGLTEAAPIREDAVLAVLAGTPLAEVATAHRAKPAELADAVEVYQRAGREALARQETSGWRQVYIQFPQWQTAEQTAATHLAPLLRAAQDKGTITTWWFMRKHPCWRLRFRPGPTAARGSWQFDTELDDLVAQDRITAWWPGIYEAETAAFGGENAMSLAHDLFRADSDAIINMINHGVSENGLGRRELSLVLCGTMLRAAGLEHYEQGDVWHRVTKERPLPADIPTSKLTAMAQDLRELSFADTTSEGPLFRQGGPLRSVSVWAGAFRATGRALGEAARAGTLERGLREVLSYLVIFHWNRLGLPARTQSILARAACTAILEPTSDSVLARLDEGVSHPCG